MTKDCARSAVMGAISMALKDSILQQGFEIICKENAELEKENKELKTVKIPQLERRIASIRGCHSVDVKKLNTRIKQVERLKKENAELKKDSKGKDLALEDYTKWSESEKKKSDAKLDEAKEIITALLNIFVGDIPEEDLDVGQIDCREKAEKFLKEADK